MPPLPPWIRSIKRPLDQLVTLRRDYEDLPDTEPGEELGARAGRRLGHGTDASSADDRPSPSSDGPRRSPRR